jgi:lipopolysaccharide transport system ATP-binding protein
MSDSIITVENLSKKYIISHKERENYSTMRDAITNGIKGFGKKLLGRGSGSMTKEDFWALKDINFEIKQGDRVGIIGRNGAGKSTLLKTLSRITEPTTGKIHLKGRVASLLEVGTGFHPELTGRENIFLNGAIMGMSKVEIKKKFDEIVAFAEVEKFLDTPVKRYSSGMYVRLAFAVAAHLEPEIMIVDEVLAVGDTQFQKKCLGKMEDVGKEGRTVIFVSHNMGMIKQLCNSLIVLKSGELDFQGGVDEGIDYYLNECEEPVTNLNNVKHHGAQKRIISSIKLLGDNKREVKRFTSGEEMGFELTLDRKHEQLLKNTGRCSIALFDVNKNYLALFSTELYYQNDILLDSKVSCIIPRCPLSKGTYYMNLFVEENGEVQDWIKDFIKFEVDHGNFHPGRQQYPVGYENKGILVEHKWENHV